MEIGSRGQWRRCRLTPAKWQILVGVWEGVLDAHGQQLHVRFNFTKNADGSIKATFDSLDQEP